MKKEELTKEEALLIKKMEESENDVIPLINSCLEVLEAENINPLERLNIAMALFIESALESDTMIKVGLMTMDLMREKLAKELKE